MKKYFLTVDTFRGTTKLGEMVAVFFEERYRNSIVTATQLLRIPNEIEAYMYGLTSKNNRPFTIHATKIRVDLSDPKKGGAK